MPRKRKVRRRRSPAMAKVRRRRFLVILLMVAVVAGVSGFFLHQNPEWRENITETATNIWDSVSSFFIDLFAGGQIPADGYVYVHFIDVGQGDAVLIRTAYGAVLIDGGDNHMGQRVIDYLHSHGVRELAYVIATHPHADHIGGLIPIISEFPIGTLIMPNVTHTTLTFERFIEALENSHINVSPPVIGDTFAFGEAVFTIIAPNSSGYSNLNDYSVATHLTFGSTSFLFTGDAERTSEGEMVALHSLSANVLHVGHHGSNTSTTEEFLSAVSPQIAVISVGANNTFGHPHSQVITRLVSHGVRVYRTDIHGNITITSNGTNVTVNY
ncbi:MAG: MBL fold metallo-hydrolase [Defluviitaleaceae bacterium]|nr:MBL fold metallo-hydrolase [Defluviitaleaceae bacterium]